MMDGDPAGQKARRLLESLTHDDHVRGVGRFLFGTVGLVVFNALIGLFDLYRTIDARITKAEQLCDYYRPKGWPDERDHKRDHKPVPPGSIPCDSASERELDRTSEFPVKRYFVLFVDYVSTADGKNYSQRIQIPAERLPPNVNLGTTIRVSASTTDPYSVRGE
jgi:hypothetical protein